MIINHSKKFIFFANRKTASTSTAIALSSSCNKKDVITPLGRDERIRRELGHQGPINFIPWWNVPKYLAIEAKSKAFKRSANRELKTIGLHTHIEAKTALEKSISALLTLIAISASALSEIPGTTLFRSSLSSKKANNSNPWI